MSKNIEMQEKTSASTYETLYPKTSASQVFLSEEAKQATNGLENLDQAASFWGGGQNEIGDIKISARNNLGNKWLECNGNIISKTDYPQLANYCEEKGFPFGNDKSEIINPNITYSGNYYSPQMFQVGEYFVIFTKKMSYDSSTSKFTLNYSYTKDLNSTAWTSKVATIDDVRNYEWRLGGRSIANMSLANGYYILQMDYGYIFFTTDITNANSWDYYSIIGSMNSEWDSPIIYQDGYYQTTFVYNEKCYGAYRTVLTNAWTLKNSSAEIPIYNISTTYKQEVVFDSNTGYFIYATKSTGSSSDSPAYTYNLFYFKAPNTPISAFQDTSSHDRSGMFFNVENGVLYVWYYNSSYNEQNYVSYNYATVPNSINIDTNIDQGSIISYSGKVDKYIISNVSATQMTITSSLNRENSKDTTYTTTSPLKTKYLRYFFVQPDGLYIQVNTKSSSNGNVTFQKYPFGIMLPNITITSTNSNVKAYIKGKD